MATRVVGRLRVRLDCGKSDLPVQPVAALVPPFFHIIPVQVMFTAVHQWQNDIFVRHWSWGAGCTIEK